MILRLLWPSSQRPLADQLIVGAVLCSRAPQQPAEGLLVAAVVGFCPLDSQAALPGSIHRQLEACRVQPPACQAEEACLAVLGVWAPLQDSEAAGTQETDQAALRQDATTAANGSRLWLCVRGCQPVQDALRLPPAWPWRCPPHLSAPVLDGARSQLPAGVSSVQVFMYAVPAQQPGYTAVQLPQPPSGPQVPWMQRDPGVVSLSALMRMLQEAHAAVAVHAQQQLQPQSQAAEEEGLLPADHGWGQLAAVLAATRSSSKWRAPWGDRCAAAALAAASAARGWLPLASAAAGSGRAPRQPAAAAAGPRPPDDGGGGQGAAGHAGQPGAQLQLVVQHLLGLLVGLNLLLHEAAVLQAAAGAAAWLEGRVLQPHTQWLMQAQPGGIKLHLELSLLLGTAAQGVLQATLALYRSAWPLLGRCALWVQAAAAAAGGASWGCAAAADILLALLAPLALLYAGCAAAHRLQLRCLAASWRLIRGRQKVRRFSDRRRQQQLQQQQGGAPGSPSPAAAGPAPAGSTPVAGGGDGSGQPGDEVSVEQLIVGVLLFTPLLGLLPTTAAWYLSVCGLYCLLHGARLLLVGLGSWMQLRPLHVLAARCSRPQLFPGQLVVRPLRAAAGSGGGGLPGVAATDAAGAQQAHAGGAAASATSEGRGGRMLTRRMSAAASAQLPAGGAAAASPLPFAHYYSMFYEPLPYSEVLAQSIKQQQDLLWRTSGAGGVSAGLLWWLRAVASGRTWGLRP